MPGQNERALSQRFPDPPFLATILFVDNTKVWAALQGINQLWLITAIIFFSLFMKFYHEHTSKIEREKEFFVCLGEAITGDTSAWVMG